MGTTSTTHKRRITRTETDLPQFLTRKQVAALLNVSEKWLAQSGKRQGPNFHKFGASCRYLLEDVTDWARQQRVVFPT